MTNQNYLELKQLYEKYSSRGLEILAFPCNNFGGQEPGTNAEILEFARQKGASYPIFGKLECDNDPITDPLYKFLKSSLSVGFLGLLGRGLKWNFAKFLCDANGVPIKRYLPVNSPLSIEADILALLKKNCPVPVIAHYHETATVFNIHPRKHLR